MGHDAAELGDNFPVHVTRASTSGWVVEGEGSAPAKNAELWALTDSGWAEGQGGRWGRDADEDNEQSS